MFSYFGAKTKLAKFYPAPKHGKIIEPFAGSARYSLLHFENDVVLYDLSDYVIQVWRYLIAASRNDILSLPDVDSKISLDSIKGLTTAERYLIGFSLVRGKAKPRKVGHGQNSWNADKRRIADDLYKIRHWQVHQNSYTAIANELATWFIDPPYELTNVPSYTDRYPHFVVNRQQLARFAITRRGLVIVCEGDGATYLPFQPLVRVNVNTNSQHVRKNWEMVYIQDRR